MKRILSVLGLAILVGLASLVPLPAKAQTEGMANFVHRDSTGLATVDVQAFQAAR